MDLTDEIIRKADDLSPTGRFFTKKNSEIVHANTAFLQMTGYTLEELLGKKLSLFNSKQHPTTFYEELWDALLSGKSWSGNMWNVKKNGEEYLSQTKISPVGEELFVAYQQDITRVWEMQNNEKTYREIFDFLQQQDTISININRLVDGTYIHVNKGFCNITGYTEQEALGKTSLELDIWDDVKDRAKLVKLIQKEGSVLPLRANFKKKNGELVHGVMYAWKMELNGELALFNLTLDETRLMKATQAIHSLKEDYKLLFDLSQDLTLRIDAATRVIELVSPSIREIGGYEVGEVEGNSPSIFYANKRQEELFLEKLMKEGKVRGYEVDVITKHKGKRTALVNAVFKDGKIHSSIQDITPIVNERNIAKKADELKGLFLSQIGFEIRTPVTGILSYLSLLKSVMEEDGITGYDEYFKTVSRSSDKLLMVTELIVNSSIIASGRYSPVLSKYDLEYILEAPRAQLMEQAEEKDLDVVYEGAGIDVYADLSSAQILFTELYKNAVKYTERGVIGTVIEEKKDVVNVRISDTGIGINDETLKRIYKPFEQGESGYTRGYDGWGLGLYLVKNCADISGWEIDVSSKKGKGTTFTVTIPKGN